MGYPGAVDIAVSRVSKQVDRLEGATSAGDRMSTTQTLGRIRSRVAPNRAAWRRKGFRRATGRSVAVSIFCATLMAFGSQIPRADATSESGYHGSNAGAAAAFTMIALNLVILEYLLSVILPTSVALLVGQAILAELACFFGVLAAGCGFWGIRSSETDPFVTLDAGIGVALGVVSSIAGGRDLVQLCSESG